MKAILCRGLLCTVLLLAATGSMFAQPSHGAAAKSILRYVYVPGQVLDYLVTSLNVETISEAGKADDVTRLTVVNHQTYTFHKVDRGGNSSLSIVSTDAAVTTIHDGKTTHSTIPASQFGTPTNACLTEVDGSDYCFYRGAYGLNDIGQLASVPVAPGSTWSSSIDNTWDILNRKPATIHNQLTRISTDNGGPVATIVSTMQQSGPAMVDPKPVTNAEIQGRETGTWQFAIKTGRFLGEDLVQTFDASGMAKGQGSTHSIRMHSVGETIMKLVAVQSTKVTGLAGKQPTTKLNAFAHTPSALSLAYPSTWKAREVTGADVLEVSVPGQDSRIDVSIDADTKKNEPAQSQLAAFGSPIGAVVDTTKSTTNGSVRSIDAVVRLTGEQTEAQVEIRIVRANGLQVYEAGIVSLGVPGMGPPKRPTNFAQRFEQVLTTMDSIHMLS